MQLQRVTKPQAVKLKNVDESHVNDTPICMDCRQELTAKNNGIAINGGDFYQCDLCHYMEHGIRIIPGYLIF